MINNDLAKSSGLVITFLNKDGNEFVKLERKNDGVHDWKNKNEVDNTISRYTYHRDSWE